MRKSVSIMVTEKERAALLACAKKRGADTLAGGLLVVVKGILELPQEQVPQFLELVRREKETRRPGPRDRDILGLFASGDYPGYSCCGQVLIEDYFRVLNITKSVSPKFAHAARAYLALDALRSEA